MEDFQDYEVRREFNFSLIKYIEEKYDGILIIPMTIVNHKYFNEIVSSLRNQGVIVKHFTLMASKEALSNETFQLHIDTENMSIDDVVEKIAFMSGVNLLTDNTGRLKKKINRI